MNPDKWHPHMKRLWKRVHYRYLRHLARNKPDEFCFRSTWRNFQRRTRARICRIGKLVLLSVAIAATIFGLPFLAYIAFVSLQESFLDFLNRPQVPLADTIEYVSRFETILFCITLVMGMANGVPTSREGTNFTDARRTDRLLRWLRKKAFIGIGVILCLWNAYISARLRHPWWPLFLSCMFDTACCFAIFHVSWYRANRKLQQLVFWALVIPLAYLLGILVFCTAISIPPSDFHAFTDLTPVGWKNLLLQELGKAPSAGATSLAIFGIVCVGVVGFAYRKRSTTVAHLRLILSKPKDTAKVSSPGGNSPDAARSRLRKEFQNCLIRSRPRTIRDWFCATWELLKDASLTVVAVLICQAIFSVIFSSLVFGSLILLEPDSQELSVTLSRIQGMCFCISIFVIIVRLFWFQFRSFPERPVRPVHEFLRNVVYWIWAVAVALALEIPFIAFVAAWGISFSSGILAMGVGVSYSFMMTLFSLLEPTHDVCVIRARNSTVFLMAYLGCVFFGSVLILLFLSRVIDAISVSDSK